MAVGWGVLVAGGVAVLVGVAVGVGVFIRVGVPVDIAVPVGVDVVWGSVTGDGVDMLAATGMVFWLQAVSRSVKISSETR